MEAFVDRYRRIKASEATSFVGKPSLVKGEYWDGCPENEIDVSYPIEIQEFNPSKKITGMANKQAVMGFLCTGDAASNNPSDRSLMWMSLESFSKYHAMHLKANPPPPPPVLEGGGDNGSSLTVPPRIDVVDLACGDDDDDDGDRNLGSRL
jgi:hypothetical protein